jgi:8-oxo-dGTP pyrophosphatase MutT (NUDIX family)
MNESFNGVIGIVVRRGKPDKYLLVHNLKTGNITFPAGGREKGEKTSIETLKREILEETGLQEKEYKIIETGLVHEFVYNSKKSLRTGEKVRQIVYLVETPKKSLVPEDPDVKLDGWYSAEDVLKKLTFEDSKELFRRVLGITKNKS